MLFDSINAGRPSAEAKLQGLPLNDLAQINKILLFKQLTIKLGREMTPLQTSCKTFVQIFLLLTRKLHQMRNSCKNFRKGDILK